jgi:Na+/H+ antiporter NhaD/arsenite permease-like protein
MERGQQTSPGNRLLAAILIFAGTYLALAVGRIPFLRVDRTGAAIVGASLMLAFNVLTVEEGLNSAPP